MKIELVGGPLDGMKANPSRPAAFLHIDARGRCWKEAGAGRVLYRQGIEAGQRAARRPGWAVYGYAELLYVLCPGCFAWHVKVGRICTLCGARLPVPG